VELDKTVFYNVMCEIRSLDNLTLLKKLPIYTKVDKTNSKEAFPLPKVTLFSTCLATFLNFVYSLEVYARLPILPYRYLLCHPLFKYLHNTKIAVYKDRASILG
jgi:hypothetical protein